MKKPSRIIYICASILALTLLLSGSATGASTASPAAESSKETCLECHGPFDRLIAETANYVMPSGEKMSPHRYVPHKSKDIPECNNCHTPHPVPLTSTEGLPAPKTDYCYTCHHTGGLIECRACHK